jgi:Cu+-exporting ATPase
MYLDFGKFTASSRGISSSQVNFPEKKVHYYNTKSNTQRDFYLLSAIGYEPYISLENYETGANVDRYFNL